MQAGELVLRDIHRPPAPPWWPPAPGWWVLAAAVLLVLVVLGAWWLRRRRRRRSIEALFDRTIAAAASPADEVAAMSELMRRAARRHDPGADRLDGEAWLAFLDRNRGRRAHRSARTAVFSTGAGRLLLDGGYRRDVDPAAVAELRPMVRERFVQWMVR